MIHWRNKTSKSSRSDTLCIGIMALQKSLDFISMDIFLNCRWYITSVSVWAEEYEDVICVWLFSSCSYSRNFININRNISRWRRVGRQDGVGQWTTDFSLPNLRLVCLDTIVRLLVSLSLDFDWTSSIIGCDFLVKFHLKWPLINDLWVVGLDWIREFIHCWVVFERSRSPLLAIIDESLIEISLCYCPIISLCLWCMYMS